MITRGQYLASLYPFQYDVMVQSMEGLQKLKGIADRDLAGYLATIWDSIPAVRMKVRR